MKRILSIAVAILMLFSMTGCNDAATIITKPDETQVRTICELATLKCEYNNVAKHTKPKKEGVKGILQQDSEVWIEYKGVINLGVDMTKVSMSIQDNVVKITLPKAEALGEPGIVEGSYNKDSYICSVDGVINTNKITPEETTAAIKAAQYNMLETVSGDNALLLRAQERAKVMIENYVKNIGEVSGVDYTIEWKYIE